MSIFETVSGGRPGGLRLFADRYEMSRNFAARLSQDPPSQTISFYVGVGGNGKTSLLRHLQARCSYRLPADRWQEVWSYPNEFFVDALGQAAGAEPVPTAFLDFGAQPSGANRPQEAFSALFMLKRQLSRSGIDTPRLDFAAIAYLHKSGADVEPVIRELFPPSDFAAAASVADALLNLPVFEVGLAIVEVVRKRMDNLLSQRRIRRRVPGEVIADVLSLVPEPDLIDALPRFFSEDLRAALADKKHDRLVLLFDTYESLAGETSERGRAQIADRSGPRWFRSLLGHLPLASGVVVVVAGRSHPRWSEAIVEAIPERFVETTALGALPAQYADTYLTEAGITDPAQRQALIAYTSVEPGQVHPLLLGLSADVVAAGHGTPVTDLDLRSSDEFRSKERVLAARLLSTVSAELEDAIIAVSAARSFDQHIFVYLGSELDFPVTAGEFRRLIAFSFVIPGQQGPAAAGTGGPGQEARYAIHNLLRRALAHIAPDLRRRAHEALISYYQSMPEGDKFTARLEQIYHAGQLDPADGAERWRDEMTTVLSISRYDRARALVSLLSDLEMPSADDAESCTYLAAKAEIGLGRWDEAARLLGLLPSGAAYARLLQADLAFVRGDFATAQADSAAALAAAGSGAERLPFLYRAAELRLFLGQFEAGRDLCEEGLALVSPGEDDNEAARWHDLLAEIEFFSGDIEAAKTQLASAQRRLDQIPDEERDLVVEANVRVDEAVVAEAENRPLDARRGQTEALRIRREIADARGSAHALNGLGLAALQLGDATEARARFTEAARAARDLGEGLLQAKVQRGMAEAAVLAGHLDEADRLAAAALAEFERRAIPYDVTHAWITQAKVSRARGDDRTWLSLADQARREIERAGHRSLYARCPEIQVVQADRIASAMTAFAAGDALGVPWEGLGPEAVDTAKITDIPATGRDGWPPGTTSDDTAQMLLVATVLAETGGRPTSMAFLERLAAAAPGLRGIGPSTQAALDHFERTGEPPRLPPGGTASATNGAAMRMLPVGWAIPAADADRRRQVVSALAIATHPAPAAIGAACMAAAMATWSVEGVGLGTIIDAAVTEAEWVSRQYPETAAAITAINAAASGNWQPPAGGISLDATETIATVVHVLSRHADLAAALSYAVTLGGDTDTVAALVGGILGGRDPAAAGSLPWLGRVSVDGGDRIGELASKLQALRRAWYSD